MRLGHTIIEDTYAEAFGLWAARILVTAVDQRWVRVAADQATGFAASIIGCDAEAGIESLVHPSQTPDRRPGAYLLFFSRSVESLTQAVRTRVGQCVMTCPTTAVFDGRPPQSPNHEPIAIDLGGYLSFFGDTHQSTMQVSDRSCWRIPVMDGDFLVEDTVTAVRAVGGGNFLICGRSQSATLAVATCAVDAIEPLERVICPAPGGIFRSGSKVGSSYKNVGASTHEAYCPTLRHAVSTKLRDTVACVYEIVIDGLDEAAVASAMRVGIVAACDASKQDDSQIVSISAGNYRGRLGSIRFGLHEVLSADHDGSLGPS